MLLESIKQSVESFKRQQKRATFTLELGRGETYATGKPTLYGHGFYPRGSVLAGRDLRRFIDSFDSVAEAHKVLAELKIKYDDMTGGGSTHIPIEQMVSHLPDDTDY